MMFKLRKELKEVDKKGYASESINLLNNAVDCSEGCNPFGYPKSIEQISEKFLLKRLGHYPHSMSVYEAICQYWEKYCSLKRENIMLTEGSAQAIFFINSAFNATNAKVVGIAPQFSGYVTNAKLLGLNYEPIILKKKKNYKIEIEDILKKISDDVALIYIDNPNNPTGQVLSINEIERILIKAEQHDVCLVIDEAYGDFVEQTKSAINLLDRYKNLIVLRTLSKGFGLAGARIGYMIASESLMKVLNKLSNPYQLGEFGRAVLEVVLTEENELDKHKYFFANKKRVIRDIIGKNIKMAESCDSVPICLLYHVNPQVDLQKLFLKHNILTVSGLSFDGLDASYVRIRFPKEEEMPLLILAIEKIEAYSENI